MDKTNYIPNEEQLYRRIRQNSGSHKRYHYNDESELELDKGCFYDKKHQPSVYRAKLMNCDPSLCTIDATDGVVGLTAGEIRSIKIDNYCIKVCSQPVDNSKVSSNTTEYIRNDAHAIIAMTPTIPEKNIEKKMKSKSFDTLMKALAHHVAKKGWILKPSNN